MSGEKCGEGFDGGHVYAVNSIDISDEGLFSGADDAYIIQWRLDMAQLAALSRPVDESNSLDGTTTLLALMEHNLRGPVQQVCSCVDAVFVLW